MASRSCGSVDGEGSKSGTRIRSQTSGPGAIEIARHASSSLRTLHLPSRVMGKRPGGRRSAARSDPRWAGPAKTKIARRADLAPLDVAVRGLEIVSTNAAPGPSLCLGMIARSNYLANAAFLDRQRDPKLSRSAHEAWFAPMSLHKHNVLGVGRVRREEHDDARNLGIASDRSHLGSGRCACCPRCSNRSRWSVLRGWCASVPDGSMRRMGGVLPGGDRAGAGWSLGQIPCSGSGNRMASEQGAPL